MIAALRKRWLRTRIKWAQWDQAYWQSGISVAIENAQTAAENMQRAVDRERILRDAIINVDYKLPRVLRSRSLT